LIDGDFKVVESTLDVLSRFAGPIYAVSVSGTARQGKSTLVNLLIPPAQFKRASKVFEVTAKTAACTRGVWIWSEPIPVPGGGAGSIVLIDTEGMGKGDNSVLSKITGFATLCSSVVVFNVDKDLNNQNLNELGTIVGVAQALPASSRALLLPELAVAIRDFRARFAKKSAAGPVACTAQEYMVELLTPVTPDDKFNDTRKAIRDTFKEPSLLTLARPDPDDLKDLSALPEGDFRDSFQAFQKAVMTLLLKRPMRVQQDAPIASGKEYAAFLRGLVAAISSSLDAVALPSLVDAVQEVRCAERAGPLLDSFWRAVGAATSSGVGPLFTTPPASVAVWDPKPALLQRHHNSSQLTAFRGQFQTVAQQSAAQQLATLAQLCPGTGAAVLKRAQDALSAKFSAIQQVGLAAIDVVTNQRRGEEAAAAAAAAEAARQAAAAEAARQRAIAAEQQRVAAAAEQQRQAEAARAAAAAAALARPPPGVCMAAIAASH
jgi:hypothetical protein